MFKEGDIVKVKQSILEQQPDAWLIHNKEAAGELIITGVLDYKTIAAKSHDNSASTYYMLTDMVELVQEAEKYGNCEEIW
jgi:hypothetical protein